MQIVFLQGRHFSVNKFLSLIQILYMDTLIQLRDISFEIKLYKNIIKKLLI